MFLYINIMALIILIVTISILAFLVFIRYVEKTKENFISNMKKKQENFSNVSIRNVHSDTGELDDETNDSTGDSNTTNAWIENFILIRTMIMRKHL